MKGNAWKIIEYKEDVIKLCALGYTDSQIADELFERGMSNVNAEDIKAYRRKYKYEISKYAEEQANEIISQCIRTKRPYRLAELDALAGKLRDAIDDLLDEDPVKAAKLMQTYLNALNQLNKDISDGNDKKQNKLIFILNVATPEQKARIVNHLLELERLQNEVMQCNGLLTGAIEGEFTAQDVNQD